jgi:hypothetical protein
MSRRRVRLIPEIFNIAGGGVRVHVDREYHRLDVVMAPAFMHADQRPRHKSDRNLSPTERLNNWSVARRRRSHHPRGTAHRSTRDRGWAGSRKAASAWAAFSFVAGPHWPIGDLQVCTQALRRPFSGFVEAELADAVGIRRHACRVARRYRPRCRERLAMPARHQRAQYGLAAHVQCPNPHPRASESEGAAFARPPSPGRNLFGMKCSTGNREPRVFRTFQGFRNNTVFQRPRRVSSASSCTVDVEAKSTSGSAPASQLLCQLSR